MRTVQQIVLMLVFSVSPSNRRTQSRVTFRDWWVRGRGPPNVNTDSGFHLPYLMIHLTE